MAAATSRYRLSPALTMAGPAIAQPCCRLPVPCYAISHLSEGVYLAEQNRDVVNMDALQIN